LASQVIFHKDCIPPRKDNGPHVKVPTDGKYPLKTSLVPPGVSIEAYMLGKVVVLKFVDHDIIDEKKIPKLAREKYLCTKSVPSTTSDFSRNAYVGNET
jgi:hypothetical protein